MEQDQKARIFNPRKSRAAKMAWKTNRHHYNRANRKRERVNANMENNSSTLIRDLKNAIREANVDNLNSFKLSGLIDFDSISGGITYKINEETNTFSISFILDESKVENDYKFETNINALDAKQIFNTIGDELLELCRSFDESLNGILIKHGLLRNN